MNWLCWHVGTVTDPKLAVVAKRAGNVPRSLVVSVWAYLLERAAQAADRGAFGAVDTEAAATALDCEPEQVAAIMAAMTAKEMIADGRVTNWGKRQHGNSTQRVRAFRERQKQGGNEETLHPATGNNETATPRSETVETASNPQDRTGQDREKPKTIPSPETAEPQRASAPPPAGERTAARAKEPKGQFELPKAWLPDEFAIAYAINLGLTKEQIRITGADFVAYWTEGMGKGTRRSAKGWKTAWFNRCKVIAERGQRAPQGGSRGNRVDPAEQDRQDSLSVLRAQGYRPDGDADDADNRGFREADRARDEGDHRGAAADRQGTSDGRDPQAGGVVQGDEHQADQRGDTDGGVRTGAEPPAPGPADQGVRGDQEGAHLGLATAPAAGDISSGERGVQPAGQDQAWPVSGQPGPGGERAPGDTGSAGRDDQGGRSGAGPLARDTGRVGPQGEDLLDIPAFLRRTDTPAQVH